MMFPSEPCRVGLCSLSLSALLGATGAAAADGAHGTISRRNQRARAGFGEGAAGRGQFSPLEAILGFDLSLQ